MENGCLCQRDTKHGNAMIQLIFIDYLCSIDSEEAAASSDFSSEVWAAVTDDAASHHLTLVQRTIKTEGTSSKL